MSDDTWSIAAPPFKPEDALQRLRRDLRELGLAEREGRFERRGLPIARVAVDDGVFVAAVVRRPSRTSPEWQSQTLKSGAAVRDFSAALKKKLTEWSDRDEG